MDFSETLNQNSLVKVLNNLPGMFYRRLNDIDGTIIYASAGSHLLTGYKPEEFLNYEKISFRKLVHHSDIGWLLKNISHNLNHRNTGSNEYRIICKEGGTRWVRETSNGVYTNTGELEYIEGFIQEITSEKIAKTLSNSFSSYQNAVNKCSIVSITDKTGKIIYANDLFCYHSKYSQHELIRENHRLVNSGYHSREFFADLWDTINSGKIWRGEIKNKAKDGTFYWVDTVISSVLNEEKEIAQFLSIRNIITEKKEIESALKESEEINKDILSSLTSQIAVINAEGIVLTVNKAWSDFSDLNDKLQFKRAGVGTNYFEILENMLCEDGECAAKVLDGIKSVLNKESDFFKIEFPSNSNDKWFILSASPYGKGMPKAVVRYIDISDRKNQELQLKKVVNELTNRNNELMQFSYIVSHNLRAPIAQLIGLSNLLDFPNVSEEEKQKIIKYIRNSTLKMDEVVKDLNLVLSSRSSLNLKTQKINIKAVINSIIDTLGPQINDTSTTITQNISAEAIEIFSIKHYIESIFYNLISNAIKYRYPDRPPLISVNVNKAGDVIIISVSDNGVGIDLSRHTKELFGLYKRFHTHIDGKGLGLHMTKTQVDALGGTISLESEVNKGSKFTIHIPCLYEKHI